MVWITPFFKPAVKTPEATLIGTQPASFSSYLIGPNTPGSTFLQEMSGIVTLLVRSHCPQVVWVFSLWSCVIVKNKNSMFILANMLLTPCFPRSSLTPQRFRQKRACKRSLCCDYCAFTVSAHLSAAIPTNFESLMKFYLDQIELFNKILAPSVLMSALHNTNSRVCRTMSCSLRL